MNCLKWSLALRLRENTEMHVTYDKILMLEEALDWSVPMACNGNLSTVGSIYRRIGTLDSIHTVRF